MEPQRRRRGAELEAAILDAAWEELADHGYASFTIEAVAQRAGTSKPVVYRRWADKHELVRAAVRRLSDSVDPPVVDTGTLRGDLLEVMEFFNRARMPLVTLITVHLGSYFQESGTSPADLREVLVRGGTTTWDTIIDRAVERGEIDGDRLTQRIRDLPFALFRHEVLMTLKPIPMSVVEEVLDTIFLPLVRPRAVEDGMEG
jgi:AcrR family transcriptional regulator